MIIVYYSRGSPFPALLASLKHCRPALRAEQAWPAAAEWLDRNRPPGSPALFLKKYAESEAGDIVCPASAAVPGELLGRTLQGLGGLLGESGGVLTACYPLSWSRRWEQGSGSGREIGCWREIEALVERTRLRIELIRGP